MFREARWRWRMLHLTSVDNLLYSVTCWFCSVPWTVTLRHRYAWLADAREVGSTVLRYILTSAAAVLHSSLVIGPCIYRIIVINLRNSLDDVSMSNDTHTHHCYQQWSRTHYSTPHTLCALTAATILADAAVTSPSPKWPKMCRVGR